ncbi:MAG: hypothetical protein R2681_01535 [Pyrinomonadaceae bacterium]
MRRIIFVALGTLLFCFGSAAYGYDSKVKAEWIHPEFTNRSFSKIMVVAVGDDAEAVDLFESLAVKQLRKKGINAVTAGSVFSGRPREEIIESDELIAILTENKIEGVVTMRLINTIESVTYVPGRIYSVGVGKKAFGIYWISGYKTESEPGTFVLSKSYIIEANLFDLKDGLYEGKETLVWTGQSALVNPKSREKAAKTFTKPMMDHLVKKGIVKPELHSRKNPE